MVVLPAVIHVANIAPDINALAKDQHKCIAMRWLLCKNFTHNKKIVSVSSLELKFMASNQQKVDISAEILVSINK
jgi:hypothetical protein